MPPNIPDAYSKGQSVFAIAQEQKVSCNVVHRWLRQAGIDSRGRHEAQQLRHKGTTLAERKAMTAAANASMVGRKTSEDVLRRKAKTLERMGRLTPRERKWADALLDKGIVTKPQMAFDRFNADLAVPDAMVAIEVQNGWHQHKKGKSRGRDARKRQYLESIGWVMAEVYDRQMQGRAFFELISLIHLRRLHLN